MTQNARAPQQTEEVGLILKIAPESQPQTQLKEQPRFKFYQLEMTCHLLLFSSMLLYTVYVFVTYAQRTQEDRVIAYMKPSWLTKYTGLLRDAHDPQWQSFRSNLLSTLAIMIIWKMTGISNRYSFLLGTILVLFSFRADSIIYFGLLFSWYYYTKIFCKFRYFVITTWAIAIGLLLLNQQTNHFSRISDLIEQLIPDSFNFMKNSSRLFHWAQLLNMNLLKLMSFSIDNHRGDQSQELKKHKNKCKQCQSGRVLEGKLKVDYCYKGRDLLNFIPNPQRSLELGDFFNYILFAPTFFAGPPISYKNFLSFRFMQTSKTPGYLHLALLLASFEIFQHILPIIPPPEDEPLIILQFFCILDLMFIWYKFIVIWRTYRLWALMCGVDVIDNLQRCVWNNYGFQGFWRMWHRGFNHWLIRYLYIPLGGNKNYLSVVIIVCFVAFWHDHTPYIVFWALIIVAFMVPELALKKYFRERPDAHQLYQKQWFKYASAVLCGLYIYMICLANIIGFGVGKDISTLIVFRKLAQNPSVLLISVLVVSQCCLLMFYQRDLERGVKGF